MKKEYKVFNGNTLQEGVDKALAEGFRILNLKETWDYKKKIKSLLWYTAGSVFINGIVRPATIKELKDLKSLYGKDGRVLFVGNSDLSGNLIGYYNLYDISRFVGVKKQ